MTHAERPAASAVPAVLQHIRSEVDRTLLSFLEEERASLAADHERFVPLFDEVARVVRAGGKRLRPTICWLGYWAAGGEDDRRIARVAAALELFHTFALIHDDVMDESASRRGVPTIHVRMAEERGAADAESFGVSAAILAGDFAAVLADHLFVHSGFPAHVMAATFSRYNRMRVEVAVGQFLDLEGSRRVLNEAEALEIAALKSGSYTVEGPLEIGAILGGGSPELVAALSAYATPLGQAFQLADDLAGLDESDLAQRRPTILLARARAATSGKDRAVLDRLGTRGMAPGDEERAREIIVGAGVVDDAQRVIEQRCAEATAALGRVALDAVAREGLVAVARLIAAG